MSDQVRIGAGWALWGKRPGSNDDYSVLASSAEPLSRPEFAKILTHFAPGTPPAEPGLPGSLPWVTISRVGVADEPYLGIAIQEPTDEVDGAGRPITQTSYFCFPYAELARPGHQVSYASLYREVASLRLPLPHDGLIELSVRRLDPAGLGADIAEFGEASAGAAAALLLGGPVSIVASDGSALDERLRYLDAVAALLPYGYRTGYTAATWSDSGARHRIRLAFAGWPREDAGVIRWRSAPPAITGDGPAATYFRRLRQVRGHRPGPAPLAELIRFLASDTEPRRLEQPEHAADSLREFDLPFAVLDEVEEGTAAPADIRQVFTRSRITELPADGRRRMLAALISLDQPEDLPTIGAWWQADDDDPAALAPPLVRTCRGLLWSPDTNPAVRDYLALASGHGLADHLLAGLVVLPEDAADLRGGLNAAAQLLIDRVLIGPDPAVFSRTQTAMAGSPLLACALLAKQAGPAQGAGAAVTLSWLQPTMRGFLRPFGAVLGDAPGAVERSQLERLARCDMACISFLLQAASNAGRLDRVLPGFASWLARAALSANAPGPAGARYWRELAWALAPADAASRAWLDLALLVSGNDPRFLLTDPRDRQRYDECFAAGWSALAAGQGESADARLTTALIGYLGRQPWTDDQAQASAIIDITDRLTAGGKRPKLLAIIVASLYAAPKLKVLRGPARWVARLRRSRPDVIRDGTLILLRETPPGTTIVQLVGLCLQAFRNKVDAKDAAAALGESGAIASGADVAALVEQLRLGLGLPDADRRRSRQWLREFAAMAAAGAFGEQAAARFSAIQIASACNQIGYHLDLLHIAATGGRKDAPPVLSDDEAEWVTQIHGFVEQLLRDSRRPPPGRPHMFGGGKQGRAVDGGTR